MNPFMESSSLRLLNLSGSHDKLVCNSCGTYYEFRKPLRSNYENGSTYCICPNCGNVSIMFGYPLINLNTICSTLNRIN